MIWDDFLLKKKLLVLLCTENICDISTAKSTGENDSILTESYINLKSKQIDIHFLVTNRNCIVQIERKRPSCEHYQVPTHSSCSPLSVTLPSLLWGQARCRPDRHHEPAPSISYIQGCGAVFISRTKRCGQLLLLVKWLILEKYCVLC